MMFNVLPDPFRLVPQKRQKTGALFNRFFNKAQSYKKQYSMLHGFHFCTPADLRKQVIFTHLVS